MSWSENDARRRMLAEQIRITRKSLDETPGKAEAMYGAGTERSYLYKAGAYEEVARGLLRALDAYLPGLDGDGQADGDDGMETVEGPW